ncbi:neuroglobin-like [Agrilus planipennis]|uniref:Neuroglobin-like n=1 Tax=Agrilus planipennis TaxID=224129 RepID=A0A7F5QWF2_AGRPL|nr:neuroglobin-like [Agrilus planipennis]XP_025829447.1 neuroglobin-like [Agrilus planipennis]XP_025829448.1 neuroglobin-like [Agrilus planipennis]XP_025829451.1 neuroglobin-like [Agrilus planipennis]
MGCSLAKNSGSKSGGKNKDALQEPPPVAAPADPRLPLTAKQKYSMMASWKGISRAMEQTGINMFIKLFEEHQELLTLFEKFRELKTKEDQVNSMELAAHATTVMNTLDEGIKGLDNMDTFFDFVHHVGALHRKIPGFKVEYFWKIETPFLTAVEQTLGDRYTENVENIYKITIKFILDTLVDGYNNGESSSARKPAQTTT